VLQREQVLRWRDKAGHEVDSVLKRRGQAPLAIECKWSAYGFRAANLRAFRTYHPEGENLVVCQDVDRALVREADGIRVTFVGLPDLARRLTPAGRARRARRDVLQQLARKDVPLKRKGHVLVFAADVAGEPGDLVRKARDERMRKMAGRSRG
jgi:hypothetical protein